MRVLMLTDLFPPIIGGLELHVQNLSAELALRGHDVAVATLWHAGSPEYEVDQSVRIHRLHGSVQRMAGLFSNVNRRFAPPCPDPEVALGLRRIIARERPDVVHAHNWLVHSFVPLKRWSRTRLVLTLHEYSLVCSKKDMVYRGTLCSGPQLGKCLGCCMDHYGLPRALPTVLSNSTFGVPERAAVDIFLPVSQAVAHGNQLDLRQLPFQVIPNFLRDDAAPADREMESYLAQLPPEEFILFVGALGRHKGIDVLLEAYSGLTNPPPLVLIGTPWVDTPAEFPPGTVVLSNWPHSAVMGAWSRCLMGVAPSVWPEPCPTVVMEAMEAGRPVVASNIGGLPDLVVDGRTGILTLPAEPVALRQAVQRLLDDPALRERMGMAGKQHLVQFKADAVVPRIERVYEDLIRPACDNHGE